MDTIKLEDLPVTALPVTSLREVSAAQTLRTIEPWLPYFGVNRVVDVSLPGVPACPVFQVVRADARSDYFNAGKGYSRTESQVSGLMEAIEVHCYERADPARLQRTAASGELPVVAAHDHLDNTAVWLPAHAVYRDLGDGRLTAASSNGVASGNTATEAVLHAMCEMLERHALAAFHAGRPLAREWVQAPGQLAPLQRCLAQLQARGMAAHFLLISSAAAVPVFICFLTLADRAGTGLAVQGYGAHLDPAIAMARALAEAVQILALCPAQEGVDSSGAAPPPVVTSKQAALLEPAQIASGRRADFLLLQRLRAQGPVLPLDYLFDDAGTLATRQPAVALDRLVSGLRDEGARHVLHAVISPVDLPVVVVKCFCPGLDCVAGL